MALRSTKWVKVEQGGHKLFYGEYNHSTDVKGRVILPSSFREELGDKFMVAKWLDKCLCVFTQEEWDNIREKIAAQPSTDAEIRKFSRMFFSGAGELEPDKQGRVVLPQNLREYAELSKDVVIVGVGPRAEIWDKAKWIEYNGRDDMQDMSSLAEKLAQLGI